MRTSKSTTIGLFTVRCTMGFVTAHDLIIRSSNAPISVAVLFIVNETKSIRGGGPDLRGRGRKILLEWIRHRHIRSAVEQRGQYVDLRAHYGRIGLLRDILYEQFQPVRI